MPNFKEILSVLAVEWTSHGGCPLGESHDRILSRDTEVGEDFMKNRVAHYAKAALRLKRRGKELILGAASKKILSKKFTSFAGFIGFPFDTAKPQ